MLEAPILDWTLKGKPADASTHWSTRKLGGAVDLANDGGGYGQSTD